MVKLLLLLIILILVNAFLAVPEPVTSTGISSNQPQEKLNTGVQLFSAATDLPQEKME